MIKYKNIISSRDEVYTEVDEEGNPNNCFNLIKPFVMVFAEQQCKNHANPSLRSGTGVKG